MTSGEGSLPPALSAKYPRSFAYKTMKDRIPVIIAKTVDHLNRSKDMIVKEYGGEAAREELKAATGSLSQLRYEVMTNKPAALLRDSLSDQPAWNAELKKRAAKGDPLTWFDSDWLWMECYMYRRMQEAVAMCKLLKDLDLFQDSKQASFTNSYAPIATLTSYLKEVTIKLTTSRDATKIGFYFTQFMQMALWGNKCDLSISAGQDNYQTKDPLQQLTDLKPKLLVDDTLKVFDCLYNKGKKDGGHVDIVMDNAGFEQLTDWCLAEFLLVSGLTDKVIFHIKPIPWFVSDVTPNDFSWTLTQMSQMNHHAISHFAQRWKSRMEDKSWVVQVDNFWSMPNDYSDMQEVLPSLYRQLAQSDLVIFKGDLNYRKLTGDLNWDPTTTFETSLRGFLPSSLCALRTLKSDSVVGLKAGQAKEAERENEGWMVAGEWAVLSFAKEKVPNYGT